MPHVLPCAGMHCVGVLSRLRESEVRREHVDAIIQDISHLRVQDVQPVRAEAEPTVTGRGHQGQVHSSPLQS